MYKYQYHQFSAENDRNVLIKLKNIINTKIKIFYFSGEDFTATEDSLGSMGKHATRRYPKLAQEGVLTSRKASTSHYHSKSTEGKHPRQEILNCFSYYQSLYLIQLVLFALLLHQLLDLLISVCFQPLLFQNIIYILYLFCSFALLSFAIIHCLLLLS